MCSTTVREKRGSKTSRGAQKKNHARHVLHSSEYSETIRVDAETTPVGAETIRVDAETTRVGAETIQVDAEST